MGRQGKIVHFAAPFTQRNQLNTQQNSRIENKVLDKKSILRDWEMEACYVPSPAGQSKMAYSLYQRIARLPTACKGRLFTGSNSLNRWI